MMSLFVCSLPVIFLFNFPENGRNQKKSKKAPEIDLVRIKRTSSQIVSLSYVEKVMKNWSRSSLGCCENEMTIHRGGCRS